MRRTLPIAMGRCSRRPDVHSDDPVAATAPFRRRSVPAGLEVSDDRCPNRIGRRLGIIGPQDSTRSRAYEPPSLELCTEWSLLASTTSSTWFARAWKPFSENETPGVQPPQRASSELPSARPRGRARGRAIRAWPGWRRRRAPRARQRSASGTSAATCTTSRGASKTARRRSSPAACPMRPTFPLRTASGASSDDFSSGACEIGRASTPNPAVGTRTRIGPLPEPTTPRAPGAPPPMCRRTPAPTERGRNRYRSAGADSRFASTAPASGDESPSIPSFPPAMPTSNRTPTRVPRAIPSLPASPPLSLDPLAPPEERESVSRSLRELDRSLRTVHVTVSQLLQRCGRLMKQVPETLPQRDVLHLRARLQSIEQCTRDAEHTLARLRSRADDVSGQDGRLPSADRARPAERPSC